MEFVIRMQIQGQPEGVYLATSEDLPGLVAQGWTAAEALEIARDVASRLIEARRETEGRVTVPAVAERTECTIPVGG
jgi:predicted RNase H-like HicB family nuclease